MDVYPEVRTITGLPCRTWRAAGSGHVAKDTNAMRTDLECCTPEDLRDDFLITLKLNAAQPGVSGDEGG